MQQSFFTLTDVPLHTLMNILNEHPHLINKMERAKVYELLNSMMYSHTSVIKSLNPAFTKDEIVDNLTGVNQRAALSHFLKTQGKAEDYEFALQYDGTFLGSVPISRRRVDLVKKAIDSKVLPEFKMIPKKFREPTHHICKHYLQVLNSMPPEFFDPNEKKLLRLLSYEFNVSTVFDALSTENELVCIQLFKKCARFSSLLRLDRFEKWSQTAVNFLLEHANECLDLEVTKSFPSASKLGNVPTAVSQPWLEIAAKCKIPLRLDRGSSVVFRQKTEKVISSECVIDQQRDYFTLEDAMRVLDVIGPVSDKLYLEYPILSLFRSEINLMMI